jgi:superfamily I DNA/RNA helicase
MRMIVTNNDPPLIKLKPYDIIVLDEVQDMTFLYYRLVIKYIKDIGSPVQLMVLGDYMQGLYEFKGADIRFLTMATQIWYGFTLLSDPLFIPCELRTSYRITNQMADFVNHAMLGSDRLHACREGEPVCYIRRRIHELQKIVVNTIRELIKEHKVEPSDIFVLGGSVKGQNSHIRKIENALVEGGIPWVE